MEALFTQYPVLTVASALFVATVLATLVVGGILAYHLFKFSLSTVEPVLTVLGYMVVSFALCSMMFTVLFYL